MVARRSQTWFFVGLLTLTLFVAWLILAPYLGVFVLAGTLAFLFQPWYQKILKSLHNEALASFIIVLVVMLIVFVPLTFFGARMFGEATTLYVSLTGHGGFDFGAALTNFFHTNFPNEPALQFTTVDLNSYLQQGLTWLIQNIGPFFSQIAQVLFATFLSLFGLFYLLKDGERLKAWFVKTIPLPARYTEDILKELEGVANSVVKGTLLVAVIQGVVLGIGMFFFRIPDAIFWGMLAIPVSIIPVLGTWLVAVPAVIYLFLNGSVALGVGLAIWSIVLINAIYNVLTPRFIRRGLDLHPYLILLSVLGGIGLCGPIGFLIGPLVMSLAFSLLKTSKEFIALR
jgi:predicted PurR-regulated permease PerM